jgi:hypothetical protein
MATKHHGKLGVIKMSTAAGGAAVDISGAFDDVGEDQNDDRPTVPTFGDLAHKYPLLGLQDNKYSISGFYRNNAGLKVHGKACRIFANEHSIYSFLNAGKLGRKIQWDNMVVFGDIAKRYPLAGLFSGSFSASGFVSYAADELDEIMRAMRLIDPSTGTAIPCWSVFHHGTAVGAYVDMFAAVPMKYAVKTGEEKPVTMDLDFAVDDQIDLGVCLHGETAETAVMEGTAVDEQAATSRGGAAHLHVTAFTGTTATVKIQHSTDGTTWADLVTFTAVTAATAERVSIPAGTTINRHVRASITSATITTMTFVVTFARRGFVYVTTNGNHRHFCGLISGYINGTATSSAPLAPTTFEYVPVGETVGSPKHTAAVVLESYEVDFGEEKPTRISVSMPVDGEITYSTVSAAELLAARAVERAAERVEDRVEDIREEHEDPHPDQGGPRPPRPKPDPRRDSRR